jgi:hypothetical protein
MEIPDCNDPGNVNCSFIQFVFKIMTNVYNTFHENLKVNENDYYGNLRIIQKVQAMIQW